jgi:hypothetical protein
MDLHLNALTPRAAQLFPRLKTAPILKPFYLVGGTGLALQLGHRISVDFDFFTQKPLQPLEILSHLQKLGPVSRVIEEPGTLHCQLHGVRLSFLVDHSKLLKTFPVSPYLYLASLDDIACYKLVAISSRGSRKDFIDLYYLLRQPKLTLKKLFQSLYKKYSHTQYNAQHILRSLTYFPDADQDPDPRMLISGYTWPQTKDFFNSAVKDFQP